MRQLLKDCITQYKYASLAKIQNSLRRINNRWPIFLTIIQFKVLQTLCGLQIQKYALIILQTYCFFKSIIKITINQNRISMPEPNLPTLTLFTRSPSHQKRNVTMRSIQEEPSIFDVLKQSNKIQNQPLIAPITPGLSSYQNQYHRIRNNMQLEYLNTYYDVVRERPISQPSYHSTHRAESFESFGGAKAQVLHPHQIYRNSTQRTTQNFNSYAKAKCECQQEHTYNQHHVITKQPLVRSPYLTNQTYNMHAPPPVPFAQQNINLNKPSLNKKAYLEARRNEQIQNIHINAQKSIIHQITQSQNNTLNISKFVNESKNVNINQSLLIEEHPKKQQKTVQAQTEDPFTNKSVFMINTSAKQSQVMNKKNFQKTLKDLNGRIHSLKLQLDSEDVMIDLSDLILTKDQYIDESNGILTKLNAISQGRSVSINNKMTGSLVWPDGI